MSPRVRTPGRPPVRDLDGGSDTSGVVQGRGDIRSGWGDEPQNVQRHSEPLFSGGTLVEETPVRTVPVLVETTLHLRVGGEGRDGS